MKFALIKNNKVDNIILASLEFAQSLTGYDAIVNVTTTAAGIGWGYLNGQIVQPEPEPEPEPGVPYSVTKRQAKQQLLVAGLLSQVQPAIDSIVDPIERQMIQIYWDDSQEYERNHPQLVALATKALGLADEQLDDLFRAASTL